MSTIKSIIKIIIYKNIRLWLMAVKSIPVALKNIREKNLPYKKVYNCAIYKVELPKHFKNKFKLMIYFIKNLNYFIIPFIITLIYFYISLFYIQINFSKQIIIYYLLLIFYYLLMSSFNNFLVKYRFGKFTSAIQRFWKRTGMIFWLIEGFLFLLFFYYFLNSSQEPLYMFDYSNLNQEYLLQLKTSFKSLILLSFCIIIGFILTIKNNYNVYNQNIILLSLISLIIFFILYIESYQFSYIINLLSSQNWLFDESYNTWILDVEKTNFRVKQQYFILCLVAKYWHFIFIFISWFFFFIKTLENKKINYTILSYNNQNIIILYILNLCCMVQWLKFILKKQLEITYYWFHIQYDVKFINNFFFECINIIISFFNINYITYTFSKIIIISQFLYTNNQLLLWINCDK